MTTTACCSTETRRGRLVIIGGGSAAFAAAVAAAPIAASLTIVNSGLPMGGCCVNVGCVPSKFLVQAARQTGPYRRSPSFNGMKTDGLRLTDFSALTAQNQALVNNLQQEKYAKVIAGLPNVRYVDGFGRLISNPDGVAVAVRHQHEDATAIEVLPADRIILATGVRTRIPNNLADDLASVPYLTNETIYFLSKQPESLIILGGGYVALETAQAFSRLGTKVIIIQRSERLLSGLSASIGDSLAKFLRDEGLEIHCGFEVASVGQYGENVVVKGRSASKAVEQTFTASHLLLATGRQANADNTSELPIERTSTPHGGFIVSATLQTSIPDVYAAGDCIAGSPQYVYTAAAEGQLAAVNALASFDGSEQREMDYSAVPWVIFTSPAVAGIGLDLEEAQAKGIDADASILPLRLLPRAVVQQDTRGFVTLIRDKSNDAIIGARVLAEEGGELIMEAAMAVRYRLKVRDLASMFHPYLTWNEAWKLAALGFDKDVETLSCCAT